MLINDNAFAAYMIPSFPQHLRFLHVDGGFTYKIVNTPLQDLLFRTMQQHEGTFYVILRANRFAGQKNENRFFGGHFQVVDGTCRRVARRIVNIFYFCEATRIKPLPLRPRPDAAGEGSRAPQG